MKEKLTRSLIGMAIMLFAFAQLVQAQSRGITGSVSSAKENVPIIGANILIKGTTRGTVSDLKGKFSIDASPQDTLLVTYLGYDDESVVLGARSNIEVKLYENSTDLDEVVVVGYGVQRKREITGAIASIKSDALEKIAGANFTDALQGQLAGVNVQASSGAPGESSNIQIRGIGSLTSGSTGPLYVVDGVPYDSDPNISSSEIESIEVLKDAASASIYGTRASNGVILVTTKRGKAGAMKIDFEAYYGVQNITSGVDLLNTKDYLAVYMMREELNSENGGSSFYSPLENNPDGLEYDTNWMDELTNNNAPIQNYSLNVSGGKEDLTYNFMLNYFDQEGVMVKSNYNAFSFRANTEYKHNRFSTYLTFGINSSGQETTPWGLHSLAISLSPMSPPIDWDATSGTVPSDNSDAVGSMSAAIKQECTNTNNGYNANLMLGYEILDGLSINGSFGGSTGTTYTRRYEPEFLVYDTDGELSASSNTVSSLYEAIDMSRKWQGELTLRYSKQFEGGHSINALMGYTMEQSFWDQRTLAKNGFSDDSVTTPSAGTSGDSVLGTNSSNSLIGMLARVMYNYQDRYLLSASVRRDGSSRFGLDKWASFPSVSAGWSISEEPFYKNWGIKDILTDVKLRASWGTAGNQSIPNYQYTATVQNSLNYVLGTGDQTETAYGSSQRGFVNPYVKWETSLSRNFGVDISALKGKVTLNADYYIVNKNDLLLPVDLAPSTGVPLDDYTYENVYLNAGDLRNEGIEIAVTYRGNIRDFRYSVSATYTRNVNMVTSTYTASNYIEGGDPLRQVRNSDPTTYVKEGYEAGAFFLIPNLGTVKTQEQLEAYQEIVPTAQLGDLWLQDTNGDKQISDADRVYCGSGTPKFEGGLNVNLEYKGIDLNVQLYGSYGNMVYNGAKLQAYQSLRHQDLLYCWSPENPTSNVPTPRKEIEHNNTRSFSDYYLEDGSYLRVKNIQLGYSLPSRIIEKMKLRSVRVYLSAQNPFTLTKYTGYDPEVGGDGLFYKGVDEATYPVAAQYRMGLQVGF